MHMFYNANKHEKTRNTRFEWSDLLKKRTGLELERTVKKLDRQMWTTWDRSQRLGLQPVGSNLNCNGPTKPKVKFELGFRVDIERSIELGLGFAVEFNRGFPQNLISNPSNHYDFKPVYNCTNHYNLTLRTRLVAIYSTKIARVSSMSKSKNIVWHHFFR